MTEDETHLMRVENRDLIAPPEISKYEMGVLPIWLGKRDLVEDDLGKFYSEISFGLDRQFNLYPLFSVPDADKIKDDAYPAFVPVDLDLRRVLERIQNHLAIFIITTAQVSEYTWLSQTPQGLLDLRRQQGREKTTFVYKVILGSGFSQEGSKDPEGRFSQNEMRAHELDGVYLPYGLDWPTVSIRRLIEFMNRVLGYDLLGEKFPNYSTEELQKMVWNINREDFNVWTPREDAIPKYPIVNGRPQFPF